MSTREIVLFLLILWATAGLTFIHLAVLGARMLRRRRAERTPPAESGARPTITFVVPVYNDGATVGPTIRSILRQSVPPDRILVVNDGSTDGTREVLDAYRERGVDVMHLPRNVGKSRALAAALESVDTELVAITDADSIVHQDYVKEILGSFRDPELAAVAGAVESIPHTWVTAARQLEYMVTVRIDRDAEHTMNSLVVLPGVSTTYRTSVLREMGFEFDTIAEDFDLTFRLQRAGRKIAMNMRAKVFTSDPPTLKSYYRQLIRWYTDFFLVLKKHRSVLGKRTFGAVELPMLLLNATLASALYFLLPVWMALYDPASLLLFFATSLFFDALLVAAGWWIYRRRDLFWALASRTPTRIIARFAFLFAMTRVAVGRPGLAWDKLERRGTTEFLAASDAPLATPATPSVLDAPPLAAGIGEAARRVGLALLVAGGLAAPMLSVQLAIGLVAAGFTLLALRSLDAEIGSSAGRAARVASLVAVQVAYLAAAAVALGAVPLDVPAAWRVAALAVAGQAVFLTLAWPWRVEPFPWFGTVGHGGALVGTAAVALSVPLTIALVVYAASFLLIALAARSPPSAAAGPREELLAQEAGQG